jgi:PadR family transcriptional regulator PadR
MMSWNFCLNSRARSIYFARLYVFRYSWADMDRAWITQLRKGLTELSVLAALQAGEAYGYELLQRLGGSDPLATTPATVYPVLARLTDAGLLAVREAPSPAGPPRRYYRLTAAGQAQLREMGAYWQELVTAVDRLMRPPSSPERSLP